MSDILKNNEINQYFGNATYTIIPPIVKGYRLYIICGFSFLEKYSRIWAFILISNEIESEYIPGRGLADLGPA